MSMAIASELILLLNSMMWQLAGMMNARDEHANEPMNEIKTAKLHTVDAIIPRSTIVQHRANRRKRPLHKTQNVNEYNGTDGTH